MQFELNRTDYNERVKDMQRFCTAADLRHRIQADEFQVYYGGWNTLGIERSAQCSYDGGLDAKLRVEVVSDILHG